MAGKKGMKRSFNNQETKNQIGSGLMGSKRMKKCSVSPSENSSKSNICCFPQWNLLPPDIQMRVLACLDISDLFRSCLLVCKQLKDTILTSSKLQYKQSMWATRWTRFAYEKLGSESENGPYKILNVMLEESESQHCFDQGIVCIKHSAGYIRVGNPVKNEWKKISHPSKGFVLNSIRVDTLTSPASFKIVATCYESTGKYHTDISDSCMFHTEIFDSKMNTWKKGSIIPLGGRFQDKLESSSLVIACTFLKTIITYDFEQDRWNLKRYVSPKNTTEKKIVFCMEKPVLVSYLWPWVFLWKEHSCCKGVVNWALMTKLDMETFLAQHKLKSRTVISSIFHRIHCRGNVITVTVTLSRFRSALEKYALVDYDMGEGCWKLEGSLKGLFVGRLDMKFTPSLITVV